MTYRTTKLTMNLTTNLETSKETTVPTVSNQGISVLGQSRAKRTRISAVGYARYANEVRINTHAKKSKRRGKTDFIT